MEVVKDAIAESALRIQEIVDGGDGLVDGDEGSLEKGSDDAKSVREMRF